LQPASPASRLLPSPFLFSPYTPAARRKRSLQVSTIGWNALRCVQVGSSLSSPHFFLSARIQTNLQKAGLADPGPPWLPPTLSSPLRGKRLTRPQKQEPISLAPDEGGSSRSGVSPLGGSPLPPPPPPLPLLLFSPSQKRSEDWQSTITREQIFENLFFERLAGLGSRAVTAPFRAFLLILLVTFSLLLPSLTYLPVDTPWRCGAIRSLPDPLRHSLHLCRSS